MRTLAIAITVAALSLLGSAARAVGTQTGQVTQVIVRASNGLNYVYINCQTPAGL